MQPARRMVTSLMKLQMSNGEARLLDRVGKTQHRRRCFGVPAPRPPRPHLTAPSDTDYRGGAPVTDMWKDGPSHKAGELALATASSK